MPEGTTLRGRIVDVEGAGRVTGQATIRLALTDIVRGSRLVAITTDAVGTATGGDVGTGVVPATRGDEIRYGAETRFDFTLANSVTL